MIYDTKERKQRPVKFHRRNILQKRNARQEKEKLMKNIIRK